MDNLLAGFGQWLDPQFVTPLIVTWGGRIVAALAVFVIGRWIAKAITRGIRRAMSRADIDETLGRFLGNLIYILLISLVILTALSTLGINTTNFLAIVGAAGLAVGLALKDSLSNFAAGVMLVLFRPFKVGDYIDAAGIAGSVESIGIFSTVLKTPDNRVITVPNGLIYGATITNFSAEATRRVDLLIGISYDDDIGRARALIQGVISEDNRILREPPSQLLLMELGASSVDIAVRAWVKTSDYWNVRSDLLERIKRTLEGAGLSIPYPQRDVHIVSSVSGNV
ncbi:MAG TPA: mechanosensitive ion channel domain-containing protein [Gammaproteobacteria bacterium]|nr:mechanosensitive ion channel domain-containing protein [Gammaproteobacteria bacterium]